MRTIAKKTHGSVAHLSLMFIYLFSRLASEDGSGIEEPRMDRRRQSV